ncbi:DUF4919 domain-containing protein [Agaribacterium sp. ZY112]|uniref:DUF4919 domain-containing protein n=1 Tax=Agaribacterium sp. ZY112 TaxID=3233574 RepID=UPI00352662AC
MNKLFQSCLFALPLFLLSACSQTPHQESPQVASSLNPYEQQVELSKEASNKVDYSLMRLSYSETALYKPWDSTEHEAGLALLDAQAESNYPLCLELSSAILGQNYTSLMAHLGAWSCNKELGNYELANKHRKVLQGLIESISASGDGLSAETAFIVNSETEMRDYIQIRGLLMFRQDSLVKGGKHLRHAWATDPQKASAVIEMYFDISRALFSKLPKPTLI